MRELTWNPFDKGARFSAPSKAQGDIRARWLSPKDPSQPPHPFFNPSLLELLVHRFILGRSNAYISRWKSEVALMLKDSRQGQPIYSAPRFMDYLASAFESFEQAVTEIEHGEKQVENVDAYLTRVAFNGMKDEVARARKIERRESMSLSPSDEEEDAWVNDLIESILHDIGQPWERQRQAHGLDMPYCHACGTSLAGKAVSSKVCDDCRKARALRRRQRAWVPLLADPDNREARQGLSIALEQEPEAPDLNAATRQLEQRDFTETARLITDYLGKSEHMKHGKPPKGLPPEENEEPPTYEQWVRDQKQRNRETEEEEANAIHR